MAVKKVHLVNKCLNNQKNIRLCYSNIGSCQNWFICFDEIEAECDNCGFGREIYTTHKIEFDSKWKAMLFYYAFYWLSA